MGKYRKKPIVIEAFRWYISQKSEDIPSWLADAMVSGVIVTVIVPGKMLPDLEIKTLEGVMRVDYGDWIIRGVNGEIYPCKPDIFEKTYEKVD